MSNSINISKKMNENESEKIFSAIEIGLKWIRGDINLDQLKGEFGEPEYESKNPTMLDYFYFPFKKAMIDLTFYETDADPAKFIPKSFSIKLTGGYYSNISLEKFDNIGLTRIRDPDFVHFPHFLDSSGSTPLNIVNFSYQLAVPEGVRYDVLIGAEYAAEFNSETGPWDFYNIKKAENLIEFNAFRRYRE
ncbi:hypothetical protein [Paraburkholderia bannensis]|uniref:hypothetical protein n=1 Tax=Paraburkholderia bannensis TaxID=765414 RepID=UPI002AB741B9|nr:hypothetical protein [Paraburkholderia bannensis]